MSGKQLKKGLATIGLLAAGAALLTTGLNLDKVTAAPEDPVVVSFSTIGDSRGDDTKQPEA